MKPFKEFHCMSSASCQGEIPKASGNISVLEWYPPGSGTENVSCKAATLNFHIKYRGKRYTVSVHKAVKQVPFMARRHKKTIVLFKSFFHYVMQTWLNSTTSFKIRAF